MKRRDKIPQTQQVPTPDKLVEICQANACAVVDAKSLSRHSYVTTTYAQRLIKQVIPRLKLQLWGEHNMLQDTSQTIRQNHLQI